MGRWKYRKRWSNWWSSETSKAVRGNPLQQLIMQYVTSCERANAIGLYDMPLALLCHDLGSSREDALNAIAELEERGFCFYDGDREEIYVPGLAESEYLEGPPRSQLHPRDNNIKHIHMELWKHRESPFVWLFYQRYRDAFFLQPEMARPGNWSLVDEQESAPRTRDEIDARAASPFGDEATRRKAVQRALDSLSGAPREAPWKGAKSPKLAPKGSTGVEKGASEGASSTLCIQEQEQEQEQKICHDSEAASLSEGASQSEAASYGEDPVNNGTARQNGHERQGDVRDHPRMVPHHPSSERLSMWPSVDAFLTLYRERAPLEWPDVPAVLNPSLHAAIIEGLRRHPDQQFWEAVYGQAGKSPYLCGTGRRKPEHFAPGLPWLLQRGVRDGEENALKVLKGTYNPGRRMNDIPARPLATASPAPGGVGAQLLALIRGFMRELQALCEGLEQLGMAAAPP